MSLKNAVVGGLAVCFLALGYIQGLPFSSPGAVLVEELEKYYRRFDRVAFTVQEIMSDDHGYHRNYRSHVQRDKELWKIRFSGHYAFPHPRTGEIEKRTDQGEILNRPDLGISIGTYGNNQLGILAYLSPGSLPERFGYREFYGVITGRLTGNAELALPEILKQSSLSVVPVEAGGQSLVKLTGESVYGAITVWIDPSRNHVPVRIHQRKKADHRSGNHVLSEIPQKHGGPMKSCEYEQEVKEWVVVQGVHVPKQVSKRFAAVFPDESQADYVESLTFSDWQFGKQVTWQPETFIPDGTPVTVDGERHIDYEWREGKVVKKISADTVRGLSAHWFQPGSWIGISTLTLLLLTVSGMAWYWWYRRRSAAS